MARVPKKKARVEEAGVRIRLFLKGVTWWADVRLDGARERFSLKTGDHATAEAHAKAYAKSLARQQLTGEQLDHLTLGQVFDWYRVAVASKLNKKGAPVSKDWRKAAEMRIQLFERAWGKNMLVADIGQPNVNAFIAARRAGTLTVLQGGEEQKGRKPVAVRLGTTDGDLRWLRSCLNYATQHTVQGRPFLKVNPLDRVTWPRENEKNKLRPRASADRYTKTQEHTDTVDPTGKLRCALALARHTGHRESAILKLRVSDLLLTPAAVKAALRLVGRDEDEAQHLPFGGILWRAENDKMGATHISALNQPARAEVDRYLAKGSRIGEAWLFPAPKAPAPGKPVAPLHRRLASRQLVKAEVLAELEKLKGGIWHPYRRAWATDRKGFSDIDVAAAGGWSDTRALKLAYQQADAKSMLSVVNAGT